MSTVETRTNRYRLTGTVLRRNANVPHEVVVVILDRCSPDLPAVETIREHFDLTGQQARVARMLARRWTNQEIADALFISPHTARHHTEAVLRALQLHSRRAVRDRIQAAFSP